MSLNVISNFAANVAHRNLVISDMGATSSLAKLSSGSRVLSARDDATALAIGSRLRAEVSGLVQANVNAGQAVSMLQIADGAMARIDDILVRMKTLAIQASSGQLSNTERTILDKEYQALLNEVGRITDDTEFNGTQLLKGGASFSVNGAVGGDVSVDDGFESFTFSSDVGKISDADVIRVEFNSTTKQFTVTVDPGGTPEVFTSTAIAAAPGAGEFLDVEFAELGFTIKLNSQFSVTTAVADTAGSAEFTAQTVSGGGSLSLTFKVGTGTSSFDDITIALGATNANDLDSALDTSLVTTAVNAAAAITAVNGAIDQLATNRADVGAAQNRIEFASANIATAIENAEAARSKLLDLDIAQEMTNFTSKQILLQTGVSMLAQANQLPQNLLRLFQ